MTQVGSAPAMIFTLGATTRDKHIMCDYMRREFQIVVFVIWDDPMRFHGVDKSFARRRVIHGSSHYFLKIFFGFR